jgi:hypothetical protein
MRYCGQLGEERFDREVAPRCAPRYIGQELFYDRADLDAWRQALPVDRLGTSLTAAAKDDWDRLRDDLTNAKQRAER